MKTFLEYFRIVNESKIIFEELLFEAADDASKVGGASNNTRGTLHELLVGRYLPAGKKHMVNHHLINDEGERETPEVAHNRLKSQIHPKDYEEINRKAKSAADHIRAKLEKDHPGHVISHVHHTSKSGDTEKETGVKASQSGENSDSSDIYITTKHKKTGEIKKHGVSLKITKTANKKVPSSSLGMASSGLSARKMHKAHQDEIKADHPKLAKLTNKKDRKEWAQNNPKKAEAIKQKNKELLSSVAAAHAKELQAHINSGNHAHVVDHIRTVLAARHTPAEIARKATFMKHTTYQTSAGTQHDASHPAENPDHESHLKNPQNIHVSSSGSAVNFYHRDPKTGKLKKFASQAHKFESQSDPLSTLKSAGRAT